MLHDSDIAAFDIDDCRDPQTGDIAPWAWTLIDAAASEAQRQETPTGRKERWPQSLRIVRTALNVALIEDSKPVRPFGSEGPEVRAVTQARVRTEFMAAYPAEGADSEKRADAKQNAFNRALK